MDIAEKLKLQQQLGGLVLFREGVFLRAYNQSAYILTEIFKYDLKLQYKKLKCLNNQWIVMCVFPSDKLQQRLPDAELTAYGAKVAVDFNKLNYASWFQRVCRPANEVSRAKFDREKEAQASAMRSNLNLLQGDLPCVFQLPLNQQQLNYLQNWQKGNYPVEVDLAFIEILKTNLDC